MWIPRTKMYKKYIYGSDHSIQSDVATDHINLFEKFKEMFNVHVSLVEFSLV